MRKIFNKSGIALIFLLVSFILILNLHFTQIYFNSYINGTESYPNIKSSRVIPYENLLWVINPTFEDPIEPTWFSDKGGDLTDTSTSTSLGHVNFEVLGNYGIFDDISGVPKPEDGWIEVNHSIRPLPVTHEINSNFGCNVSHVYDEDSSGPFPNSGDQTANLAGVLWKRNITMTVDMSDYVITTASISSIVAGSADQDVETSNSVFWDDSGGDAYASLYDHAFFYVEISDLENKKPYRVASYRTDDLGNGTAERRDYSYTTRTFLNDTSMIPISEDDFIYNLNKVFEYDPYNFTVTLGIEIDSEDNYEHYELDVWYSLLIKSCNLTFTYEKKMDKSTHVSWNQELREINGTNVEITKANLKFKYKIDQNWTSASQNSKIKILINNREHKEYIWLIDYIYSPSFQEAKPEGYDLMEYDIMYPYEKMNLSIQVFLADEFRLDRNIVLSLDDVFLEISYIETIPDPISEPWLFSGLFIIVSIGAVILGAYLIAYQLYLKYPVPVRKIRKYRSSLNKDEPPNKPIIKREKAFNTKYQAELKKSSKFLKGTPINGKVLREKILGKIDKETLKSSNDKINI